MSKTVNMGPLGAVELRLPASTLVRYEVLRRVESHHERAMCSALGLCWGGRQRLPRYETTHDARVHGDRVFEALVQAGVKPSAIFAAGAEALDLLAEGLISEEEVAEAEGNSDAPVEQSTSQ